MSGKFGGQVALITGSSRGLGEVYARELAGAGAKVIVHGRTQQTENVTESINESGGVACTVLADISEPGECRELVKTVIDKWGRIDILINNAGTKPRTTTCLIEELSNEDLNHAIHTDLNGAFNITTAAWKHMKNQKYGRIINVSSGHVFGSAEDFGIIPLAIAKAGMISLTKSLALAGKPENIKINAVMPAALDTGSNRIEWNATTLDDEAGLKKIASAAKTWPLINWLAGENVSCSGEVFSVCNENITRVFLGDSKGFSYTDFYEMSECIEEVMFARDYFIPVSVGHFFSTHLGLERTRRLAKILGKLKSVSRKPISA